MGTVVARMGKLQLTQNEVRRKLECAEESTICNEFGKLRSGVSPSGLATQGRARPSAPGRGLAFWNKAEKLQKTKGLICVNIFPSMNWRGGQFGPSGAGQPTGVALYLAIRGVGPALRFWIQRKRS